MLQGNVLFVCEGDNDSQFDSLAEHVLAYRRADF